MHHNHNTSVKDVISSDEKFIIVPEREWKIVEEAVEENQTWVDERTLAERLHVGIRRIKNMVCSGTIKRTMYAVAVNGMKTFNLPKILGRKK